MTQTIYSVIVSHQAEVHENHLFVDREKAIAKMDAVAKKWDDLRGNRKDIEIHKYREDNRADFTPQYATKKGYWYENCGDMTDVFWEYGCVELIESSLDCKSN